MKFLVLQSRNRQIVTGISIAGVFVGMASPVLVAVWSEYFENSSATIMVELFASLLVPLSLMVLFFALFVSKDQIFSPKHHAKR